MTVLSTNQLKRTTWFMLGIFWAGLFLWLNTSSAHAQSCTFPMDARNASELNAAITCYNNAAVGDYVINITQDISLSSETTFFDNSVGATVTVNGGGYTIDGGNSVRLFTAKTGTVTFANMTLQRGKPNGGVGGAIYVLVNADVTLTEVTVSSNSANAGGGVYSSGSLTVERSSFSNNSTSGNGGGLYTKGSAVVINSTFSTNSAKIGGGIYHDGTALEAINNTIVFNDASSSAGGIYSGNNGTLTLHNNIIGESSSGGDCSGGTLGIDNTNLDSDGSCNDAVTSSNLSLGTLQNNGGSTLTHALLDGSSAIGAGDPAICAASPVNGVDQVGTQRGITQRGITQCDIGAYEIPCTGSPYSVSNTSELNRAIRCFNELGIDGSSSVISVTQEIVLDAATVPISNSTSATLAIAGSGSSKIIDGAGSYRILTVEAGNVTFRNLRLENGNDPSTDCAGESCGGALKVGADANVSIDSTRMEDNQAAVGGALYSEGNVTIVESAFWNNSADSFGGSIVTAGDRTLVMTRTQIFGSSAPSAGGMLARGNAIIYDSIFSDNVATMQHGAGLYVDDSRVEIYNSVFIANVAPSFGGGIFLLGDLNVQDSTFYWNIAERGAGILAFDGDMVLNNSTVSYNIASIYGGGIGNVSSDVTIRHATITDNRAPEGAGVSSQPESGTITRLESSIVAGNDVIPAGSGAEVQINEDGLNNTFRSNGYNVLGSLGSTVSLSGTDDVTGVTDPGLGPRRGDNGCTRTHPPGSQSAPDCAPTHALLSGSLAIDRAVASTSTHDQRGVARPQGAAADSGAFEAAMPTIIGASNITLTENVTVVVDIETSDGNDSEGDGLTYSKIGGADQALFDLDTETGELAFITAPDYENPSDADTDNIYHVEVTVIDSLGYTDTMAFVVNVTDVSECPGFPISVGNTQELSMAFACFNQARDGDYQIKITTDFTLTAQPTTINNENGATLYFDGDGYTIDGDDTYRIFTVDAGTVVLESTVLQNGLDSSNECSNGSCGGAVKVASGADVTVQNSTVTGSAAQWGGGLYNAGTLTVVNSTVSGNSAMGSNSKGWGGGIYNVGTLTLNQSTLNNNYANVVGGGLYNKSSATVSNSTITANESNEAGGGIFNSHNGLQIVNSTINANTSARDNGGGIFYGSSATVSNSIIANGVNGGNCSGNIIGVTYSGTNFASDGSCGPNISQSGTLNLDALADNGCTTQHATPAGLACVQTHALLDDSAAIDTGSNAICAAAPINNVDQIGLSRPQGDTCDVGAYEVEERSVLGDVDCSDTLGLADALMILQYNTGARTDSGGCPLGDSATELNLANGDTNDDGSVGLADALMILHCNAGTSNALCSSVTTAAVQELPLRNQGWSTTIFIPVMVSDGMDSGPVSR